MHATITTQIRPRVVRDLRAILILRVGEPLAAPHEYREHGPYREIHCEWEELPYEVLQFLRAQAAIHGTVLFDRDGNTVAAEHFLERSIRDLDPTVLREELRRHREGSGTGHDLTSISDLAALPEIAIDTVGELRYGDCDELEVFHV